MRRLDTALCFLVTRGVRERLERLCRERGLSMSQALRHGLEIELELLENMPWLYRAQGSSDY